MALPSTVYNFEISLADVDRGVYEELAVRAARHPSESMDFFLTRVLAYCLEYEEGIAFSKGGISEGDAPAIQVAGPDGRVRSWIEVGAPDAERLNKATKSAGRVVVYTTRSFATYKRQLEGRRIHRSGEIVLQAIEPRLLTDLEPAIDRRTRLQLSVTGRQLYVDVAGRSFTGSVNEGRIEER